MLNNFDRRIHEDPSMHLIGGALPVPGAPANVGTVSAGVSETPARSDHVHSLDADSFIAPVWNDLTLNTGWTNFGAPYNIAQYALVNKYTVMVRGLVVGAALRPGNVVGVLPAGFRPLDSHAWATIANVAAANGFNTLDVDDAGNITIVDTVVATAIAFASINCIFTIN